MPWHNLSIFAVTLMVLVAMVRKREFVEIKVPFFRITFRDNDGPDSKPKDQPP